VQELIIFEMQHVIQIASIDHMLQSLLEKSERTAYLAKTQASTALTRACDKDQDHVHPD
jgi:hypothetical protein